MKKERGITLIALVVTIIVLMILAGVAISLIAGDKSVMQGVQDASSKYSVGASEEKSVVDKLNNTIKLQQLTEGTADYIVEDIAQNNNASEYYGKYVDYEPTEEVTDLGWRIFYVGPTPGQTENNIYLIADYYVPREELPAAYGTDILPSAGNSNHIRSAQFANIITLDAYKNGSNSILSNNPARNWLNKYWEALNSASSEDNNIKAVSYMMDTRVWNKFGVNGKTKYVIGGPTLEMFVNSWNQVYGSSQPLEATANETGYYINDSEYVSGLTDAMSLWIPLAQYNITEKQASSMWVASPSFYNANHLMFVSYNGHVNNKSYDYGNYGFRPVVCLNSNVQLTISDDGTTYQI